MVLAETFEGLEPAGKATARVEWWTEPMRPDVTLYVISGDAEAIVQASINNRYRTIERTGGEAHFVHPRNLDGIWWTFGYTKRQRLGVIQ